MAVSKPLLNEFGIHQRLESCAVLLVFMQLQNCWPVSLVFFRLPLCMDTHDGFGGHTPPFPSSLGGLLFRTFVPGGLEGCPLAEGPWGGSADPQLRSGVLLPHHRVSGLLLCGPSHSFWRHSFWGLLKSATSGKLSGKSTLPRVIWFAECAFCRINIFWHLFSAFQSSTLLETVTLNCSNLENLVTCPKLLFGTLNLVILPTTLLYSLEWLFL